MISVRKEFIKDKLFIKYWYNKLEIIVRINFVNDIYLMSVGFRIPNSKYHNIISKEIKYSNDNYYIHNEFIPNPPFNYVGKYILDSGKIKDFWIDLLEHLSNYEEYKTNEVFQQSKSNLEKPYFYCIKKCPNNMKNYKNNSTCITPENEKKIKSICGEEFYNYLVKMGCTAVFTSDISKAKRAIIF